MSASRKTKERQGGTHENTYTGTYLELQMQSVLKITVSGFAALWKFDAITSK